MNDSERWSAARLEELQSDGRRALIRRYFGIQAFGVNAWCGAEPGDQVIDDHDEVIEGHEELYFVISGRAVFTLDGQEIDVPPGTLVFAAPEVRRGAVAAEPETVVLAIGAEAGRPFTPSAWEEWGALGIPELIGSDRYAEAADRYRKALELHPDHAGVLYNLACLLSLAGLHEEALERLGRSIELHPKNLEYARDDPDFDPLRSNSRFAAIVGAP